MSLNLTSSRIRMRDVSGGEDAFISGILSGLIAEMQSSVITNSLFVNGLLESLTVHLLRQYADARAKIKLRSISVHMTRNLLDYITFASAIQPPIHIFPVTEEWRKAIL